MMPDGVLGLFINHLVFRFALDAYFLNLIALSPL
jgi:hypothetical protein